MLVITSRNADAIQPKQELDVAGKTHVPSRDFKVELVQASAKKAAADADAKSRDLYMVPIGNIKVVNDFNVRIHDAEYDKHFDEIKESIKKNGFFPHFPLKGYAGKEDDLTFIYCVGGFTRLAAAKAAVEEGAKIDALPVVLTPPGTNSIDLMFGLDTDNTGDRLRPYERGIVMKRAINFGATEEDCAGRMGVSKQYVTNLLYLMGLPNQLQRQVTSGRASADTVIQLARKQGPTEALKTLEAVGTSDDKAEGSDKPASAPRVTQKKIREAGTEKPIPHKQLVAAVMYAIDLPAGLDFLKRFLAQEADAKKELRQHLKPSKAKAKAKAGGKSKGNAEADPFDISPPKSKVGKPALRKTPKAPVEELEDAL